MRVIFAENSKIAEVVVHGGGSLGGPVTSFTRTTSRHSSLQRQAPCAYPQSHAVGTDQCAILRIVATVIDYFSLLVTACHRLFTYHCLAPVLAGKSEHHLDLVNTCFTPTNFYVHRSQVKVHLGVRACGFRFRHQRTYVRTHTHTHGHCKYMMIYVYMYICMYVYISVCHRLGGQATCSKWRL